MVSLVQLWLPILLSSVLVFIASSLLNMLLKFWHAPDYHTFSNEDEVREALRRGISTTGAYHVPACTPEMMKQPQTQEKLKQGPNALVMVRPNGVMNIGVYLGQWFGYCVLVSLVCALLARSALPAGAPCLHVCHVIGLAALLGYAFGSLPNAIWWAHPWSIAIKHFIDGVIYAVITAATFAWLWPAV